MVLLLDWAQAVLYVVRGAVHGQFVSLRPGAEPGRARALPYFAGHRRWRLAAQRAGHLERYVFGRKTGHGFRRVRNRRGRRADIGPCLGGWITDNFSWRWISTSTCRWESFAFADFRTHQRSAVHEARQPLERLPDRLHRHWPDQLGPGQHANHLDKGQRDDWLSSGFIRFFFATMIIGIVAGISGSCDRRNQSSIYTC